MQNFMSRLSRMPHARRQRRIAQYRSTRTRTLPHVHPIWRHCTTHAGEFKTVCENLGWDENVSSATRTLISMRLEKRAACFERSKTHGFIPLALMPMKQNKPCSNRKSFFKAQPRSLQRTPQTKKKFACYALCNKRKKRQKCAP